VASTQVLLATKQNSDYGQELPGDMTGLHLAAYFGLDKAVTILLSGYQTPNVTDSYNRTPLS